MKVFVKNQQRTYSIDVPVVKSLVKETLAFLGVSCDEVCVHLVSSRKISTLHEQYFNDPSPTDCISFPMNNEYSSYQILGDIFVCPEVAFLYGKKNRKEPYRELTLYIIHGLLHLVGYDDIENEDRVEMRKLERRVMAHLKRHNLWLVT